MNKEQASRQEPGFTPGYRFPAYVQVGEHRYRERYGLDFEDFEVGQVFRHRPGCTFSQQDNADESLDTLNQAMLHFDAHYAAHTEFERPLMVTTIMVRRLVGMTWKTFNRRKRVLSWDSLNMLAPVYGGDTLYAQSEILELGDVADDPECGLVSARISGWNQRGDTTCEMTCAMSIYRRDHLPFAGHGY